MTVSAHLELRDRSEQSKSNSAAHLAGIAGTAALVGRLAALIQVGGGGAFPARGGGDGGVRVFVQAACHRRRRARPALQQRKHVGFKLFRCRRCRHETGAAPLQLMRSLCSLALSAWLRSWQLIKSAQSLISRIAELPHQVTLVTIPAAMLPGDGQGEHTRVDEPKSVGSAVVACCAKAEGSKWRCRPPLPPPPPLENASPVPIGPAPCMRVGHTKSGGVRI